MPHGSEKPLAMLKLLVATFVVTLMLASATVAGPQDVNAAREHGEYVEALRLIRPWAEKGDARAQFMLGLLYDYGKGVQQDDAEAARWYRRAADQGFPGAWLVLGHMYADGRGVPQDDIQAWMWFGISAQTEAALRGLFFLSDPKPVDTEDRDEVASRMTPDQIAEAQRLAREWRPKAERDAAVVARDSSEAQMALDMAEYLILADDGVPGAHAKP
jgi:TPR repeat protein